MQLTPFINAKPQMPIPAVDFSEEIDKPRHIGHILNKELKIYVTTTEFFTTKFREIFKKTQIKFTTAKYGRKWIKVPDLSFWPQQLNFALWCATTGRGISRCYIVTLVVQPNSLCEYPADTEKRYSTRTTRRPPRHLKDYELK